MPFILVNKLPSSCEDRIVMLSSRNFKPLDHYRLKRGLQPRLKMFYFIVGRKGDSAYVKPCQTLNAAVDFLPRDRDLLVYVNGHGKTFDETLQRGQELSRRFRVNLVVFDWPTDYLALRKTVENADEVTINFARAMVVLDRLHRQDFAQKSMSVIFHSMGNRIIQELVKQHLQKYLSSNLFDNIILNAAAVRQFNHASWVEKLHIQNHLYIVLNRDDKTLQGAMMLRLARQLGNGFSGRPARNATYVDFSQLNSPSHNLFLGISQAEKENPAVFAFYRDAFHGETIDTSTDSEFHGSGHELVCIPVKQSLPETPVN